MFIKKLELLGFKTFADKTEIELSDGITAVVGPNGCGKSNIADAILWVLGESNIRNIRGQRAIDVIFNGADKRKAIGMAEVSLTLDNTCGTLPISFSEVTVTRRTFRSGEAEYFINKSRCRLKDIYELFLDTGIGREAYSMITQGEIDAILSAKPEDRRELFEEAAGVKKYRYRRAEALRKLERTEANLHRVRDIMAEIGSQIEPLEEQAQQAKRFNEMQSRLRDIEIGLLIRDLRKFTEALDEIRQSKQGAAGKIEDYDKRLADMECAKDKQSTLLRELEDEVENARKVSQSLTANVQRLEGKAALIDEKLTFAATSRERADEDISALECKIEETRERIERLELEASANAQSESELKSQAEAGTAALLELNGRFEEASRSVNDQKANYLELAKDLAAKRNALQNSRERSAQLEAGLAKYAQEIETMQAQKQDAEARRESAIREIETIGAAIQESATAISQLTEDRTHAEEESAALALREAELARETAAKSSRLTTLREMAEAHEGFFEGVRSVMAARKSGKLAGEFAVVADVLTVPKGYETAIETALGASVQDIITDTVDQAEAAIEFLKTNRAGRATFLPLDNMHVSNTEIKGKPARGSGGLGIAADIISFDSKYSPAIRSLLGRTVIARDIESAVALSRELTGWNKIVTLEGELIVPSGAITGGAKKNRGPELLARKSEIDSLAREIENLGHESSEVREKLQIGESRLSELKLSLDSREKSLAEQRAVLAEHERRSELATAEAEQILRRLEMVELEKNEAETLLEDESESVSRLQEQLQAAGEENTDLDRKVAGAEQDIEELTRRRSEEREELMRLNVRLASCAERATALKNALKDSQAALGEMTSTLAARHEHIDGISLDVSGLMAERDAVEREQAIQVDLLAAADKTLNDLLEKRAREVEKTEAIDAEMKEVGNARNQLARDTHDADVREARLEVQIEQSAERLLTEYEVTREQALEWPDEIEIERGTATEVARLRREIKDMGPVNTGAVQEYERIKERWDFLTEQRADLESARDQIDAAIREIDSNTRGMFMNTFNTVAANFDAMFKRLFGGGRTELSLTNPNDLLETGIEVVVQPPGKKLQDMALLSGGERALTASALVFALLLAKPSPFVVMDEVDAPLDESNVERFAEVLKDFSKESQFIVITHNRATMEAANSLYGVTMQEPGVSKLISVKLAAEESAAPKPAEREPVAVE